MSGGSFNYLCDRDARELMGRTAELRSMALALRRTGLYAQEAHETEIVAEQIDLFLETIQARAIDLSGIWKAMEWYQSGDWGAEKVEEAWNAHRANHPEASIVPGLPDRDWQTGAQHGAPVKMGANCQGQWAPHKGPLTTAPTVLADGQAIARYIAGAEDHTIILADEGGFTWVSDYSRDGICLTMTPGPNTIGQALSILHDDPRLDGYGPFIVINDTRISGHPRHGRFEFDEEDVQRPPAPEFPETLRTGDRVDIETVEDLTDGYTAEELRWLHWATGEAIRAQEAQAEERARQAAETAHWDKRRAELIAQFNGGPFRPELGQPIPTMAYRAV